MIKELLEKEVGKLTDSDLEAVTENFAIKPWVENMSDDQAETVWRSIFNPHAEAMPDDPNTIKFMILESLEDKLLIDKATTAIGHTLGLIVTNLDGELIAYESFEDVVESIDK